MDECVAEGARHVFIDHCDDELGAFHSRQSGIDRRAQRHITELVRRTHLNHCHVAFDVFLAVKFRGLAKEYRNIICQTFLHAFADVGSYEEGVVLENTLKLRIDVRSSALGVKVMDVNVFQLTGTTTVAEGFN